jgi:hypothetical protein
LNGCAITASNSVATMVKVSDMLAYYAISFIADIRFTSFNMKQILQVQRIDYFLQSTLMINCCSFFKLCRIEIRIALPYSLILIVCCYLSIRYG